MAVEGLVRVHNPETVAFEGRFDNMVVHIPAGGSVDLPQGMGNHVADQANSRVTNPDGTPADRKKFTVKSLTMVATADVVKPIFESREFGISTDNPAEFAQELERAVKARADREARGHAGDFSAPGDRNFGMSQRDAETAAGRQELRANQDRAAEQARLTGVGLPEESRHMSEADSKVETAKALHKAGAEDPALVGRAKSTPTQFGTPAAESIKDASTRDEARHASDQARRDAQAKAEKDRKAAADKVEADRKTEAVAAEAARRERG